MSHRLESLSRRYGVTDVELLTEALDLLSWAIGEKKDGRRICSVATKTIIDDCLITEFDDDSNGYMYESPLLAEVVGEEYHKPEVLPVYTANPTAALTPLPDEDRDKTA